MVLDLGGGGLVGRRRLFSGGRGFRFFSAGLLFFDGDAEADHFAVGEPPFGFGDMGVALLPGGVVGHAESEGELVGFGVEVAAFGDGFGAGDGDPFGDVAEGVVESPGVWLFGSDRVGFVVGVVPVPGVVVEGGGELGVSGLGGVDPFGFGEGADFTAGFF